MPASSPRKVSQQLKSREAKQRFSFFGDMKLIQSRKMDLVTYYSLKGKVPHGDHKWGALHHGATLYVPSYKAANTRGVLMEKLIPSYYSGLSVAPDNDLLRVFQGF